MKPLPILLRCCAAAGILAAASPWLAFWWWPGAAVGHWSAHLAIGLAVMLVVLKRSALWCSLLLLAFLATVGPWVWSAWSPRNNAPTPGPGGVRLVLANVYKNNSEPVAQQVGPMLDALQPALGGRILVAVEGPRAMATALNGVQGGQVFAWTPAERSAGNIVIWTDLLARDSGMIPLAPIRSPAMFVDFDGEDGPWRLLVVHPFKPLPATAFAHWRSVLEAVADTVAASPYPVVLVGDFNGAPIDFRIRRVLAAGDLLRPPGPALGSWPQPLAAVGVSIDHCFAHTSIAVGPARPLTVPGSDHRGLVWEISP